MRSKCSELSALISCVYVGISQKTKTNIYSAQHLFTIDWSETKENS